MEERRINPDVLLEQVQQEEERKRQGKLKIFFGAAPGVGKTYAMLEAARQKRAEGIDVVVGIAETHGRSETKALLEGLEELPRKEIEYRGTIIREFDLDAALARKPVIILVDELAHTNAPGSRHRKRWQDVFELLEAGINVYTTLNVQHLESLNDIVAQITGMVVRETLPDSVINRADEIELIDLPPEDLLTRLKEGKVYVAELAARARESFFRKGNLLALREIALRRTAVCVDEQMQRYRLVKGVKAVWPAAERIMVCVGANPRSIRLIRAAKRMADSLHADWIAVNVEAPSMVKASKDDLDRLADHMRLAESLGAETVTLSGHKASEEILNYARMRNITKIIIGKPTHPRWKDLVYGSLLDEVVRGSGEIDVYVISGETAEPVPRLIAKPAPEKTKRQEWLLSIGSVAACTAIAALIHPRYFTLVDVAMVYLLGIVIVASRTGKWPSFLATILSVALFDFFFIPPFYTFSVHDIRYALTFIVMLIVGFVISRLTLRIREQANAARHRERRTAALYSLSRELVQERWIPQLSAAAIKHLSELFSSKIVILVPDDKGSLTVPVTGPETFALDQREMSVAQWTFDHRQRAGIGTDTLPGASALYLPLVTSSRTVGVLGILPAPGTGMFDQEQIHALESFANQIALAIERALLAGEAQRALLKAETEALRNTLLSSVSHDIRTPLAAITGAATALLQKDITLDKQGRQELVQTISDEAERLNKVIRNVLDMTRLEAKAITVKKEWQSIEEIVGVALNRLGDKLKGRPLAINISGDVPLVSFDSLLIEQVLMNLLDNAIKYTPHETPFDISAQVKGNDVAVELADRGPGIPPGEEERIFEKFVRGSATGGGIGLGLAICRAIINAHGGRIWAENRPGGGAVFRFALPIEGTPQMPEPEG
ncbi:MAG: sensor histidine kinase KdpD [Alphaproteobacteria bacterium]|uniref:histidine kinase n=1 Tax=Candidatus Nitrobium versatile TaxID=2884831 RepID=A0A953M3I4_9BACT|nr:sensor histidine kinase KdpD [Candidatus Nitrobium versatile]